jgi:transcriptional regulator with XRE-family HTH domain
MAAGRISAHRRMMSMVKPTARPVETRIGALLRDWRLARRLSQLDLALDAEISSRHLSYIETGRSQPSREMVAHLADVLDVPLRERNTLLLAAGFAPAHFETDLGAPEMAQVRQAIDLILQHQEPYPAFVLDRRWNVRMSNQAAKRFRSFLIGDACTEANVIRLVLQPGTFRPVMTNWEEAAGDLVRQLYAQIAASPAAEDIRALMAEVLTYPGVPRDWRTRATFASAAPLMSAAYLKDGVALKFFSTLTTFGTPYDVTLEELRVECSFPADEATAQACRRMFGS